MSRHDFMLSRVRFGRRLRAEQERLADDLRQRLADVSSRWPDPGSEEVGCEDPIFLLAAGWRSGSTLLQRMLVADPAVMIWGEPLDRSEILQGLADQWRPFTREWPKESHQAPLDPGRELSESWIANLAPPVVHLRSCHRVFLDRLFGEPARRAGRPRWGLKEVRLTEEHAAYLRWLFPRARFLFLVRDPFDAFASYKQRGPWFHEWPKAPVATAWSFGRIWSRLATGFREAADRGEGTLVRYEGLEEAAPSLGEYTGLAVARPSGLSVQPGQAILRGSDRIGAAERAILALRTRRARAFFGYASDERA
jgi:hypothetical protein